MVYNVLLYRQVADERYDENVVQVEVNTEKQSNVSESAVSTVAVDGRLNSFGVGLLVYFGSFNMLIRSRLSIVDRDEKVMI